MADTLREYLLSLGFRVDDASWRKYVGYVAGAAKTTAELGSVAVEAATAIEVAVARVARQYETLYYVSQRTGQSANYIQAAQFAYRQMGLSAEDAISAIEGVAAAMRTTPGLGALFGGASKPEDIVDKLRGLPYFVAERMGALAGLSEKTFQHLWMFGPQERQAAEDHRRRLRDAGIDAEQASERFTVFGRVLNTLEDDFDVMGTRIALDWVGPTEAGVHALDEAVQWFDRADAATHGWIGTLTSLGVTLTGLFGVEKILSKLLGFGGATMSGALAGKLFRGGKGLAFGGGVLGVGLTLMEVMKNDKDNTVRDYLRGVLGISGGDDTKASIPPSAAGAPGRGDPRGMLAAVRAAAIRNGINPDVMEMVARSEGLAETYAGGDRGTSFGAMQLHRAGPGSVGYEYERATGHSLDDPKNEAEEADFAAKWVRKHGWGAWMGARKQGITGFAGVDAAVSGGAIAHQVGGDRMVVLNQKTDIHVTGIQDPKAAADHVFERQARVNDNLVRNLVGAHR